MIHALSDLQYSIFMNNLEKAHIRDQCIMLFMLHSGLRNGEVCNLHWSDVFISGEPFHTIRVINGHSRKNDSRYVMLSGKLVETLKNYKAWFDEKFGQQLPVGHLFITHKCKTGIQQRDIQRITLAFMRKYLQATFTPHSLRHTFATRLLKCSNIRIVQQLLGHSSLNSTEIYTHPTSEERDDAIRSAF